MLLDADQKQPEPTDTWRMKYRFYYEDYTNQANTFRVWWSTEAYNNEYDIPKSTADCLNPATDPEDCVHTIRSACAPCRPADPRAGQWLTMAVCLLPARPWRPAGRVLIMCWPCAGHVLTACWPCAGHALAMCWSRADHVLATC